MSLKMWWGERQSHSICCSISRREVRIWGGGRERNAYSLIVNMFSQLKKKSAAGEMRFKWLRKHSPGQGPQGPEWIWNRNLCLGVTASYGEAQGEWVKSRVLVEILRWQGSPNRTELLLMVIHGLTRVCKLFTLVFFLCFWENNLPPKYIC